MSQAKDSENATRSRTRKHSYLVAPPLLRATEEVEGQPLLEELPDSLCLLMWGLYRNVTRWVALGGRGPVSHSVAAWSLDVPPEIGSAVKTLYSLEGAPVPASELASACEAVAKWAKAGVYPATELAFTQGAAMLRPTDPLLACRVGRLARDLSQYPRAESWLRTAVNLARGRDWDTYARSYIALANLYLDLGNYPAARVLASRALRAGNRHSLPGLAGMAYHALFIMAAQSGKAKEAHSLAQAAFAHYGTEHERIPALAHDLACFWSDSGQFARALPVFQAAKRYFPAPDDHVLVTANLARAAAALGSRAEYECAWIEAMNTLPQCVHPSRVAVAQLTLAKSACSMQDFRDAEEYAQRALDLASARGLGHLRLQAASVLEAIRVDHRITSTTQREPVSAREAGNSLAGALVLSLSSGRSVTSRLRLPPSAQRC